MAETGEIYRCEVCGMVVEVKEARPSQDVLMGSQPRDY
jgi:desulfoferrodoxin-like iron-binding protein